MKYLFFESEDKRKPRQRQIDPFTVFGIINHNMTLENRIELAEILAGTFEIPPQSPKEFQGIPRLRNTRLFYEDAEEMWDLFAFAIDSAKTEEFSEDFKIAFEKAITGNGLAIITMGLYWIRPNFFMPLDNPSRKFINNEYDIKKLDKIGSGDAYVIFLNELRNKIDEQTPGLTFPEISYTAGKQKGDTSMHTQQQEDITITPEECEIINIDPSDKELIDKLQQKIKYWEYGNDIEFRKIYNVYENAIPNFTSYDQRIEYLQLLRQIRTICRGQRKTNTHIYNILTSDSRGIKARKKFNFLNGWISLNHPLSGKGKNSAFKHIIEMHKDYIFNNSIIISQNKDATQETVMMKSDYSQKKVENIILYGPPGTGKTYSSIQYAVAIIENEPLTAIKMENYDAVFSRYLKYKDDGLVTFTTFHQSFGYEEFIEGIRPVISSEENTEAGQDIEYEIRDGIFKAFCDKAGTPI